MLVCHRYSENRWRQTEDMAKPAGAVYPNTFVFLAKVICIA